MTETGVMTKGEGTKGNQRPRIELLYLGRHFPGVADRGHLLLTSCWILPIPFKSMLKPGKSPYTKDLFIIWACLTNTLKEKERMEGGKGEEAVLDKKTMDAIFLYLPDLAYARGRKLIPQEFYELMCLCLDPQRLKTVGDLKILLSFLTALLAYYKYREKEKEGGNV